MTRHVIPSEMQAVAPARVPRTDVEAWRLRRLVESGFPLPLALELAATTGLALHALLGLVDRGCPPWLPPPDSTKAVVIADPSALGVGRGRWGVAVPYRLVPPRTAVLPDHRRRWST